MTLYERACSLSERIASGSGHPLAQGAFLAFCAAWWAFGGDMLALTTLLSIFAITLNQMVLNRQDRKEAEARQRDEAMHKKLDALLHGVPDAPDELAGIEEKRL